MLHVFALKNNLTGTYAPYEFRPEDYSTYSRRIHDLLILNSDAAIKNFLHVSTLFYVGTFDEESGKINFLEDYPSFNIQEDYERLLALKNVVKGDGKDA